MFKIKAFTLVELLAVIIILGILIAIAVPNVKNILGNNYQRVYKMHLNTLKETARNYVNKDNITVEDGQQRIVTITEMVNASLIDNVIDPQSDVACNGYIIVSNNNDRYYYEPYLKCEDNYISDGYVSPDSTPPSITIIGDVVINISMGEAYTDAGATASDNIDGDITNKIVVSSTVNSNVVGTYKVTYTVSDTSANTISVDRTVNVIDNVPPVIAFGTNGNTTYAKSRSTTVTVSDNDIVNLDSLKYYWSTNGSTPTPSFDTSFINNGSIYTPFGVTGSYYLWTLAKDVSGNTMMTHSNCFNLDNTRPTITILGDNPVTIYKDSTYSDTGATASDLHSGVAGSVSLTSTVNPSVIGTYTVTFNVSDNAGNAAVAVTRTVNVIPTENDYLASEGVNKPRLATGMTPIKWSGSAWVDTTEDDSAWYSYTTTDKQWANARTADGSMWVWIPRYIYKIPTANWHTITAGTIDVQFSINTDDTIGGTVTLTNTGSATDSNGTWTSHPAFKFGTTELTGIWVAKFEASVPTNNICYTSPSIDNCNIPTIDLNFVPNVNPLKWIYYIGTVFQASRNMETNARYGWGTTGTGIDTHLIKNVEWGAAAYLAYSPYGKNAEIWNNSAPITGCAGRTPEANSSSTCKYAYNTTNGQQASTTGNVYGMYDMRGCSYEYTSAYVDNGNPILETNGSSMVNADTKYKDLYTPAVEDSAVNNFPLTLNKKGDGLYETTGLLYLTDPYSWYERRDYMSYTTSPWFERGGYYADSTFPQSILTFNSAGGSSTMHSFRTIILVGNGL